MTTLGRPNLSRDQWSALLVTSNWRGAVHLAGHLGLLAITSTLILAKVPLWPVLLLPQGILLIFLFAPLHESVHRTAFRSKWCNDAVAFFCGWLLLLPPIWFRYFHIAHHRFTNLADKDPELAIESPIAGSNILSICPAFLFGPRDFRICLVIPMAGISVNLSHARHRTTLQWKRDGFWPFTSLPLPSPVNSYC